MKVALDWETKEALEKIGICTYECDDLEKIIQRMAQAIYSLKENQNE